MPDWFIAIACTLALLGGAAWVATKARGLFVESTFSYNKETDNGEHVALNVNLYSWESEEVRFEKIQRILALGDRRRKFTQDRFNRMVRKAQEAQDGKSHMKSV